MTLGHWIGNEWYPFPWMSNEVAACWDWLMKVHTGMDGRPARTPDFMIDEIAPKKYEATL